MIEPGRILIGTENVTKVYNPRCPDRLVAVGGVSLQIARGEALVLEGPSGSGKTSLLSLIGCMARPTSGRVVVDGRDVARLAESALTEVRRRRFGFIFQQLNLISSATVLENVLLPLVPVQMGSSEMRKSAGDVLARLELEGKRDIRVSKLSGGEQQRVAIARALVSQPDVIVADEPTAHLDRRLSGELLSILEDLHRDGKTVLIATHDPLVYESRFVHRILSMRDGRIDGEQSR